MSKIEENRDKTSYTAQKGKNCEKYEKFQIA